MDSIPQERGPDLAALASRIRGLALAIAGESHLADDLAQDAWVALLRRSSGGPGSPLQAGLSRTMRNLLRFRSRSETHRRDREKAVARPEQEACADLALERLELHRAILEAVYELKEPYRTTVLLRWFEELEPAEIARRMGLPVRTVHTRVSRALAMLRRKLGPRWGREGPFGLSALVAWLGGIQAPAWKVTLAMQTKTKVALAATVLGCAAVMVPIVFLRLSSNGQDERATTPLVGALQESGEEPGRQNAQPASPATRESVIKVPDPDSSNKGGESEFVIVGKTVDRTLSPIPFVPLVVASKDMEGKRVTSDGQGAFSVRLDHLANAERAEIRIEGRSSDVVVTPLKVSIVCSATATIEVMVLCSLERVVLRGRLLYMSDDPVPGGYVWAGMGQECHADEQGIFELSTGSWGGSVTLSFGINKSGLFSLGWARLTLTKAQTDAGVVEGLELRIPVPDCDGIVLVTDEGGDAIEGAEVLLENAPPGQRAFTSTDGVATIWFEKGDRRGVWVKKRDYAQQFAGLHRLDCGGTLNVKLAEESTCRGRVVDSLGAGISGATVEVGPSDFREPSEGQWTIAGADGRFSFKVAANDARYSLVAKTKDGRVGKAHFQWTRSNGDEILIQADQRCVIDGLVLDEDDNPVPDAAISSRREKVVDNAFPSGVTDHLGAFRLPVEETGTYIVVASKAGYLQGVGSAECGGQLVIRLERLK